MNNLSHPAISEPAVPSAQDFTFSRLVDFEEHFRDQEEHVPFLKRLLNSLRRRTENLSLRQFALHIFPLIQSLRGYKIFEDLPNDVIAGVTTGVMMIPQSMAYAALSTLPPIVGLYMSFFASVSYAIFGTGRHASIGSTAVTSLMLAAILEKYDNDMTRPSFLECVNNSDFLGQSNTKMDEPGSFTGNSEEAMISNTTLLSEQFKVATAQRLEVACGLTLVSGFVLMAASHLGITRLSCLLSNSLIAGYTVGVAFHVLTSQLDVLIGVSTSRHTGVGGIFRTWAGVAKGIPDTNHATLITSLISILVIYLVKRFVNQRYKDRLRVPIPVDLLIVILATLVVQFAKVHEDYNLEVVGDFPVGFPSPKFPNLKLSISYLGDGIIIAVIAYIQTLAIAKIYGLEHGYQADPRQEMLACGIANFVCGIFSSYIPAAAVSRSAVQSSTGGRTQVVSLIVAIMILLVILLVGPYLYYLPKCVLSAIVVVSLRPYFLKLLKIHKTWRTSPQDCTVWVLACVSTVVLGPMFGIVTAAILSLLLVVAQVSNHPVVVAGQITTDTNTGKVELRSVKHYSRADTLRGVELVRLKGPLFYVNSEMVVGEVYAKTGVYPAKIRKSQENAEIKEKPAPPDGVYNIAYIETNDEPEIRQKDCRDGPTTGTKSASFHIANTNEGRASNKCSVVILDVAQVTFLDLMGLQALQLIIKEMESVGVAVYIASVTESVFPTLKREGFWKDHRDRLFTSVAAALDSISTNNNQPSRI